jgi:hypothetical protein
LHAMLWVYMGMGMGVPSPATAGATPPCTIEYRRLFIHASGSDPEPSLPSVVNCVLANYPPWASC